MLSMILLNNKDDIVNMFSDITLDSGLTIELVVLLSKYIDWLTTDSLGKLSSENDIVKLFKMKYNESTLTFLPDVDDFECEFSLPAICAVNYHFEDVDDIIIKSLSCLESAYYASQPDEIDYL